MPDLEKLEPPAGFASRPLDLHVAAPGEAWVRMYRSIYPDPLGFGRVPSRFGDPRAGLPEGERFGVVYLGSTLKVCFLETVLRDRGNGRLGDLPMEVAELEGWVAAEVEAAAPLRLVDLRGDGPARMGVPTDAVRASSHALGRRWSLAFWSHGSRPDGLVYPSRLNGEACVAVYDRALPGLRAREARPLLLGWRAEMAAVVRDLRLALV